MKLEIQIKKLDESAKIPDQPYDGDAGFDLYANEEVTLEKGSKAVIKTGLSVAIPKGYVGLVWDKSGIAIKKGQKTLGGVIDSGYRGEIMIGLVNLSSGVQSFEKGDKIAQMLIQKVESIELKEVEELDETERGEKGFGSSGK